MGQLTKSNNKVIAGVCAGVAEYLNMDPTLVRVGFFLFVWFGGSGILLYFILALIMPNSKY